MIRSLRPAHAVAAAAAAVLIVLSANRPSHAAADLDGKVLFAAKCSACHQVSGQGDGPYPPLAGNPDVASSDTSALIQTVLNGRSGPITVLGRTYGGAMPAWRGQLSNAEIAAVLTYVRSAFGNGAAAISEDQVAAAAAPVAMSGDALYAAKCASCHQAGGAGTGAYPPLAGNPDVTVENPRQMISTIVNGRSGPLSVGGKTYGLEKMPAWNGQLSNADIAAVATYVRSAWGNHASGVTEAQVASAGPAVMMSVGASIYTKRCLSCHAANGKGGGGGVFPALAGNTHVGAADPGTMLSTIVRGKNVMPAWKGQLTPAEIAAVATYVRMSWGNKGAPVSEGDIAGIK